MISFYRAVSLSVLILVAYLVWRGVETVSPLVVPISNTLKQVNLAAETFSYTARPAVDAANRVSKSIDGLRDKVPSWFRSTESIGEIEPLSEEEFIAYQEYLKSQGYGQSRWEKLFSDPEPTLDPDAWAQKYIDDQQRLMKSGGARPTRAEIRKELRTAFPGMTLIMMMYYVFMIMSML